MGFANGKLLGRSARNSLAMSRFRRAPTHKYECDDTPLPEGFHTDPNREYFIQIEPGRDPVISIAQAIIIQALRDGCNPEWVSLLAKEFGVDLPDHILDKIRHGTPVWHPTKKRPRVTEEALDVLSSLAS